MNGTEDAEPGQQNAPYALPPFPPSRFWSPRRIAIQVAASLVLIAAGAGVTYALGGGKGSSPSKAGLYAVSPPGGSIPVRKVAHIVEPAVVDINTVLESPAGPSGAAGTGIIVAPDGLIITNNHVVEDAMTVRVTIPGRHERYVAHFVAADPSADLALIRVHSAGPLPTVHLGSSAHLVVGESVLAIGNSLGLGGSPAVTSGTIAALNRSITATSETGTDAEHLSGMLQTDAPIVPGNSGGPLVDARGDVIGLDTAASSALTAKGEPIAFAIPVDRVEAVLRRMEEGPAHAGRTIVFGRHAYLGIEGITVHLVSSKPSTGVDIIQIEPGTPADRAQIEPGDVITDFGGRPALTMGRLATLIESRRPGDRVAVVFQSGGELHTVEVKLIAGPDA